MSHQLIGLLPAEPEAIILYNGEDRNKGFALNGAPWDYAGRGAHKTSYDFSATAVKVFGRPAVRCRSRQHLEEHFLRDPIYTVWVRCEHVKAADVRAVLGYSLRRLWWRVRGAVRFGKGSDAEED